MLVGWFTTDMFGVWVVYNMFYRLPILLNAYWTVMCNTSHCTINERIKIAEESC